MEESLPQAPSNLNYSTILHRAQAFLYISSPSATNISLYCISDCWRNSGKCTLLSFELSIGRTVVMRLFCQATFWSFFFWCRPRVVDTTSQPMFLAPDGAPKFSSWNRRKVTSSQLCWQGCQHYQQKSRTEAFSCFTTEWLWETAETLKPPIQILRNENSSSQYLSCFPLPQGEFRAKVNDNKY